MREFFRHAKRTACRLLNCPKVIFVGIALASATCSLVLYVEVNNTSQSIRIAYVATFIPSDSSGVARAVLIDEASGAEMSVEFDPGNFLNHGIALHEAEEASKNALDKISTALYRCVMYVQSGVFWKARLIRVLGDPFFCSGSR